MSAVRVLMLARYFPPEYSGAAKQALSLARQLRARGHRIEFAVFGGRSGEESIVDGFPVTRLSHDSAARHPELGLWWSLARLLARRRGEFDVLHSHGAYYTQSVVGPLAQMFGLRSVVKATLAQNDMLGIDRSLVGRLHGFMLRRVDSCIAISADLAEEFRAAGVPERRIARIPNGVDTVRFCPVDAGGRRAARAGLGLPHDRPIALFAGVFDTRKNIHWLAQQWVEKQAFGSGALLLAVGPVSRGDAESEVFGRVAALAQAHPGLLEVRGYVANPEHLLNAVDLVVLPSLSEGLPNIVLEAMASGVLCLVTDVSGNTDLVRDGVTGRTFAPGDASSLGAALRTCFAADHEEIVRRARQRILEEYSLQSVAAAYERVYRRVH